MEIAIFLLHDKRCATVPVQNGKRLQPSGAPSRAALMPFSWTMMPEMDGLEAAKAIRRPDRPDAKTIPDYRHDRQRL